MLVICEESGLEPEVIAYRYSTLFTTLLKFEIQVRMSLLTDPELVDNAVAGKILWTTLKIG